jgi:organic radical activating enzyme
MFGTNPTEKWLKDHDGLMLDIVEVFSTIQGEGPHAGLRATFVRLAGCHLRCYFCDTDFTSTRRMIPMMAVVSRAQAYKNDLVVLTGGEPMRQNVVPLCSMLTNVGLHVQIETAGSFWPYLRPEFDAMVSAGQVSIVVSPKTSSVHQKITEYATAWKYIVSADDVMDVNDGLPIADTQRKEDYKLLARPPRHLARDRIYVQPMDEADAGHVASNVARCVKLVTLFGYRLSLQQHKIVGVP